MTPETIMSIGQQTMWVAVKITAPVLLSSLVVGLLISMFQAATQINEMTLTFVPKLITIGMVIMLAGPWILSVMVEFIRSLIISIPTLIG